MTHKIAGAIVAGGKSSRFSGQDKAQAMLVGQPLLQWVYSRLRPQVQVVFLNNPPNKTEHSLDLAKVTDAIAEQSGPLNGVLGCLRESVKRDCEWMLIAPCDTPFIPEDLGARLLKAATEEGYQLCIPRSDGRSHPSLSLWHKSLLKPLEAAVIEQKMEGFKQFYPTTKCGFVDWDTKVYDPFFNINHQSDLDTAIKTASLIPATFK